MLLAMAAGLCAQQAFEKDFYFQVASFWYRPLTDSTVELLPCQDNCRPLSGTAVLPETVEYGGTTYTLVRLGKDAFSRTNAGVSEVQLPPTIEEIGGSCFNGSSITSLVLPPSLRRIDDYAFFNSKITELHLPASVEHIGESAFCDSKTTRFTIDSANAHYRVIDGVIYTADTTVLVAAPRNHARELTLPPTVRRIAAAALQDISQQSRVTLNEGLEEIGLGALLCYQWDLRIPASVRRLEGNPVGGRPQTSLFNFSVDSANRHYRYENGLLTSYDGDTLFMVVLPDSESSFSVPAGIKVLAEDLFAHWRPALSSVTLPEGLEAIQSCAFDAINCEVNLPSTLHTIGVAAFRSNLRMGDLVLPAGIREISPQAFSGSSITSVVMPDSLRVIGQRAFTGCTRLQSVVWNRHLEEIHPEAFYPIRLTSLPPLPASLRTLGFLALSHATYIAFEGAPEAIGKHACSNARAVRFGEGNPPRLYPDAMLSLDTVYLPCGMAEVYRGAALLGWGDRYHYVEDCDGIGEAEASDGLTVAVRGLDLQVSAADGAPVRVLDALGRTLYHGPAATLRLPAAGIYLVHTPGHKAHKVVALP